MSDPLYSRTIPCKRCGKKGESIKTVVGWFCGQCIKELVDESIRETKPVSEIFIDTKQG